MSRSSQNFLTGRVLVAFASLIIASNIASAATITRTVDFDNIPDGTLLSQDDTFFGVLHLAAMESESTFKFGTVYDTDAGYFSSGKLYSPPPQIESEPDFPLFFHSSISASFLAPVNAVSFGSFVTSFYQEIDFSGVEQNGTPFSATVDVSDNYSHGTDPTFNYIAPGGGYLTGFVIKWSYDTGPVQLSLDNLTFTEEVPDSVSTLSLLFAALVGLQIIYSIITKGGMVSESTA